jgi:hypothetical protein
MIDPQRYRKATYLRASDLTATRTKVRIHSVGEEEIGTPPETKVVLHFTTPKLKPMSCNYTNLVTLVEGFGPDEQQWIGKVIILFKTKAFFQGKNVDAIRIEIPPQPAGPLQSSQPISDPAASTAEEDEADLV